MRDRAAYRTVMDSLGLIAVDGLTLSDQLRSALRPGEEMRFANGIVHRLPRYFYAVESGPSRTKFG